MGGRWASQGEMGLGAGRTVRGRRMYAPAQLEQLIRADAVLGQRQVVGQQHALRTRERVEWNEHADTDAPSKSCNAPAPRDGLSLAHELHVHACDATAVSAPSARLVRVGLEGVKAGYGRGAGVVRIRDWAWRRPS